MFFAICVFGVLNGLVFLPVLFSMIGPKPIPVTLPEIPDQFAQKLFKSKEKQVSTEDGNTRGDVELVVQTAPPTISMQSPVPGIAAGPQSQHEISKSMPETIQNKTGD